jgi:hypothetical protein
MVRIAKLLAVLAVLGGTGVAGYAYLGDMAPERTEVRVPVTLDAD